MSQIIVLGWDALDLELIEDFGLSGQFGMQQKKIETFSNPVIDEPHTKELWPSMITGQIPDEHGIHAVSESDGVDWGNPFLNTASTLANGIVPQFLLSEIGARLRERGAGLEAVTTEYYRENNVETIFDNYNASAISIPNYQNGYDEYHELDANRDSAWEELSVDRSVEEGIEPQIDMSAVYDILGREVGKRLGHTIQAIHSGSDIVWTWFGVIDSVGHMNPAVDADLQKDWYEVAAGITNTITEIAPDDATILSISDHGLQDGHHTEYATLCSDNPNAMREIDSVLDVKGWIEGANPRFKADKPGSIDGEQMEQVNEQLESLGYV